MSESLIKEEIYKIFGLLDIYKCEKKNNKKSNIKRKKNINNINNINKDINTNFIKYSDIIYGC